MASFLDLYGDLLDRELGSADRTQLFTTSRRKTAVNQGQREFNRATECWTKQVSIPLSDNVAEYDLESVITAADFWAIAAQGVEVKKVDAAGKATYLAGDDLLRRDVVWLNRFESGWRNATKSTPRIHYLREDGGSVYFGLYPPPEVKAGETWTATIPYVADTVDMVDDAHVPFAQTQTQGQASTNPKTTLKPWHEALSHYAAALLERLRKDDQRSELQMKRFATFVADYLQKQRPRGGQVIQFGRNYRAEFSRAARPLDPRRY